MWRQMIGEAIRDAPEWKREDYDQQPHVYSRIAPLIGIMTANPAKQFDEQ